MWVCWEIGVVISNLDLPTLFLSLQFHLLRVLQQQIPSEAHWVVMTASESFARNHVFVSLSTTDP